MDEKELNPLSQVFPNNSIKQANESSNRLHPVVSEPVKLRKKSFFRRMKDAIIMDESGNIGGYIIRDVLIPTTRDLIYDSVTGALSMALYSSPKATKGRNRSSSNSAYVSYADYYNDRNSKTVVSPIRKADQYTSDVDIRNIPFADKDEAWDVFDSLKYRLEEYNNSGKSCGVSVQDLYDVLDIGSCPRTYTKYGWYDLSGVSIKLDTKTNEWIMHMPRPVSIK